MKNQITALNPLLSALLSLSSLAGLTSCSDKPSAAVEATSASREQAFINLFRQALENNDSRTMDTLLLKDGTPAEVVDFYKTMMAVPAGAKIERVELVTPSADAAAEYQQSMPMPDGKNYRLPVTATKQLVILMKEAGAAGNATSKSSVPVAEKDGKLVIPLPVADP